MIWIKTVHKLDRVGLRLKILINLQLVGWNQTTTNPPIYKNGELFENLGNFNSTYWAE